MAVSYRRRYLRDDVVGVRDAVERSLVCNVFSQGFVADAWAAEGVLAIVSFLSLLPNKSTMLH